MGFKGELAFRMKYFFLLSLVLLASTRKFCPKKKNRNECRAKQNQYKCGVFFKDLTSKVPLAWIDALPEAIVRARKEGATDRNIIALYGSNLDAESYEGDVCGETLANTRCYEQMTKVKDYDLDSCGPSFFHQKFSEISEETVGDRLCGQVHRWLKRNRDYRANGRDNIKLAFMYSECGNEWKEISSSIGGKLVPKEPLCCTNKGKFRRCDGSGQVESCGKK